MTKGWWRAATVDNRKVKRSTSNVWAWPPWRRSTGAGAAVAGRRHSRRQESVTLARAVHRELKLFGTVDHVRRRYERRYLPGQALYRKAAAPLDRADVVLDNNHPAEPVVLQWPADSG